MNQITLPIDIKSLEIVSQSVDTQGNIIIEVKSKKDFTNCHKYQKPATKRYDTAPVIQIRHLPILDTPVYLKIHSVRYQCKDCDDNPEYTKLEGAMWALRKKYECLSEADKSALATLYKHSPPLKKVHSYALKLTHIFNTPSNRKLGLAKLDRWIASVQKSDLKCFDKFIGTLKKYKPYITNYFKKRRNSGFVEGLNNKIKVAKRRCYGFFKNESLFQRLYLDLKGYAMIA